MRIVLICLTRYGGTLLCGRRLASALAKIKGVDLNYVGSREASYGMKDDLDRADIHRIVVSTGSSKLGNVVQTFNAQNYRRIILYIKRLAPDVVHFASHHAWNTLIALGSRQFPSVSTVHDPIRHVGEESALYAGLAGVEVAISDRIIVLSKTHRTSLTRFGKSECRVDVLPHGELGSGGSFQAIPNSGQILFMGRFERYKGIDLLVDAFRALKKWRPEIRLVIAGHGELTKKMSDIKSTEDIKIYNRWLLEEELDQLCLASDLVVLPYIEATQSGIVAKAQALGRPVIVTNVGGLAEQIENGITGYIIPHNKTPILTQAIDEMLQDKVRLSDMGRAAWEIYKGKFNWDYIASQAIGVYERTIKDRLTFGPSRMTAGLRAFLVGIRSRR